MFKRIFLFCLVWMFFSPIVYGVEIEVQGEGSSEITEDIQAVQFAARRQAEKNAITFAVNKILGAGAIDDVRVQQKFNDIISQLNTYKIKQSDVPRREGNLYIVSSSIIIDEGKFRELISDMGIAINTNTVRSSAILTVLDEYFTTPSDLRSDIPLKEITVYTHDRDASYKESENLAKRHKEAKASSQRSAESASIDAKSQSSGSLSARNKESGSISARQKDSASYRGSDSAKASSKQSLNAKYSQDSSVKAKYNDKESISARSAKKSSSDSASMKKSSLDYGHFVNASDSEHTFFTNIKEYQPRGGIPDKENFTIRALQLSFQTYDIKILDNDRFKSKYFKDSPVNVEKLENSQDLDKYVKFARDEAKADFFSVGSSVIVDRGKNQNTDKYVCDGMVAIKVYSTVDSEAIASGALTESAAGNSPDQCRANVANKIGSGLGNVISNRIQEYWKKRQMYGSEYIVVLTGNFNPMARVQFQNAMKKVQGVSNVRQRTINQGKYEYVISYAGSEPLADSIFVQVAESPLSSTFNNYDFAVEGSQIKFYPLGSGM